LNNLPSIFGLALVEDGYHKVARIEALARQQIASREPELFKLARAWMPALPFERLKRMAMRSAWEWPTSFRRDW
jgi:hypothetical protein